MSCLKCPVHDTIAARNAFSAFSWKDAIDCVCGGGGLPMPGECIISCSEALCKTLNDYAHAEQVKASRDWRERIHVTLTFTFCGMFCRAIPENRGIQKMEIQGGFFRRKWQHVNEFWQKISHSTGDYKNVQTGPQCMSLIEKIEFLFYCVTPILGRTARSQWSGPNKSQ